MKSKRLRIIALVAAFAALLVSGWWFFFSEPRAHGHSLSTWLAVNEQTETDLSVGEANDAINEIGERAVPTLLKKIQASDPTWKKTLDDFCNKIPQLSFRFSWAADEHQEALRGFACLGPKGRSAIPALAKLLYDTNVTDRVAYALVHIGEEALPVLRAALTNATNSVVQLAAMSATSLSSNVAVATLSSIRELRASTNDLLAGSAVIRLILYATSEEAEAVAGETLQSGRPRVRGFALASLATANSIDSNKSAAILVRFLNDNDPLFRSRVTNTLRHINPTVAASVGISTNPPPRPLSGERQGRRGSAPPPDKPAQP